MFNTLNHVPKMLHANKSVTCEKVGKVSHLIFVSIFCSNSFNFINYIRIVFQTILF